MEKDSDVTMAVNATFNSIVQQVQMSNLNFIINMTPYGAYITLKKSTLVDINGVQALPSPPLACALNQALRDKAAIDSENVALKLKQMTLEKDYEVLSKENVVLSEKLSALNSLL